MAVGLCVEFIRSSFAISIMMQLIFAKRGVLATPQLLLYVYLQMNVFVPVNSVC